MRGYDNALRSGSLEKAKLTLSCFRGVERLNQCSNVNAGSELVGNCSKLLLTSLRHAFRLSIWHTKILFVVDHSPPGSVSHIADLR